MKTHTPGPWILDRQAGGWSLISNGADITAEPFDCSGEDAALMAAAPEMLSVLRGVAAQLSESLAGLAEWPNEAGWFDILSDCKRAIAKAEGRG